MSLSVGIAGLGVIGTRVAAELHRGIRGFSFEAVCAGRQEPAQATLDRLGSAVPLVDAEELAARCDVIVEAVPTAAFPEIARPAMMRGRVLVTVSAAALLLHPEIIDEAEAQGGRIILATGALLGFDAVRAAAEGTIHAVTMITRKPPKSLKGAPYLEQHGISIANLAAPLKLFEGTARQAVAGFPANLNVAAALGLAGVGPDRTQLEIWADPSLERNTHTIRVDADSVRFEMTIENVPSEEKPGTGRVTALSVIAALRSLNSTLRVGS